MMFRRQIHQALPQGWRAAALSTSALASPSIFASTAAVANHSPKFSHPLMAHIFTKLQSFQSAESVDGSPQVAITKEEHEEIRSFLKEFAGKSELNELRRMYSSAQCALELSVGDCETFVDRHIQKGDLAGAFQWYLVYSTRHPKVVRSAARLHNSLLTALSSQRSLDEFFYVYHNMKKFGLPLLSDTFSHILTTSMLYPQSKWSWIRQALLDSLPQMLAESASSPEQLAQLQHTLVRTYELFLSIHRPDVVRDLHAFFLQHSNTASVFATKMWTAVGVSAVHLKDNALLSSALLQLLPHLSPKDSNGQLQSPRDLIQQAKSSILFAEKVSEAELVVAGLLIGQHLRQSPAITGAVQSAAQLWDAASTKPILDANSYAPLLSTVVRCLDDNVVTKKSLDHSFALTSFLSAQLVQPVQGSVWTEQQLALSLSKAGSVVVDNLLDHYCIVKDIDNLSPLLFVCMKHGVAISESALMKVFQLFQQRNEHNLVMELFELHLRNQAGDKKKPLKPRFAPKVFGTAIHSLVQLGEVDLTLKFLREEIPRRGYFVKISFFNDVIYGLKEQGRFEEAAAVFFEAHDTIVRQNQVISANQKSSKSRKLVTMHTDGNVYGDGKLLSAVLKCCAKGRLGREAVAILYSFQQMEDKKGLDITHADTMRFFEYSIIALSTPDHVDKVPSLLLSLDKMHRPVIPSKRLLRVAYAAAIAMNNTEVAKNITMHFKKVYGPNTPISFNGVEGVREIVDKDLEVEWTQTMEALHTQLST